MEDMEAKNLRNGRTLTMMTNAVIEAT